MTMGAAADRCLRALDAAGMQRAVVRARWAATSPSSYGGWRGSIAGLVLEHALGR